MPSSKVLNNLMINKLTKAQYDAAVLNGDISEDDLSLLTDAEDKAVQVDTMPTVSASEVGNIYQYVGTTDANYTNGYFYKCVSDGQTPATYSWIQVDVQPSDGQVIQYTEMPLADSSMGQRIIQYVGYLNPFYVRGYFYFPTGSIQQSDSIVGVAESDTISRVDVDIVDFKNYVNPPSDRETIVSFICTDSEDPEVWEDASGGGEVSLSDYGIVYSGTVSDYDMIYVKYTPAGGRTWTQTDVQPAPVIPDPLPSQTGNAGKFLTTDGTDASWSDKPVVNNSTDSTSVSIISSNHSSSYSVLIGYNAGTGYSTDSNVVCIGSLALTGRNSIALGAYARARGVSTIQLNTSGSSATNDDVGTMKVANANGNFEIMSADGTIPADRLTHAINKYSTMPTAASTNEGWTVQYTGTTDANYTHGYIYECASDGGNPATYSWTRIDVQPAPVIPDPLPSQTGNSGKFLTTDGTDASWSNKVLTNQTTVARSIAVGPAQNSSDGEALCVGNFNVAIGDTSMAVGGDDVSIGSGTQVGYSGFGTTNVNYGVGVGSSTTVNANYGIGIGYSTYVGGIGAIQLGSRGGNGNAVNQDANTFKVANANGNFEIMSADGTIPTGRLTTLLEALYPVGSVYLGTQSTCPLVTLLPNSTWALVASDKALWTGDGTNGNTTIAAALPNIKAVLTVQDGAGASKKWAPGCTVSGAFTKENVARDAAVTGGATSYNDAFDLGINAHESNSIYDDNATTVQPPAYVVNVWRRTA